VTVSRRRPAVLASLLAGLLFLLAAMVPAAAAQADDALPWLAIDIDRIGVQHLDALKNDPRVVHWSELGDRLLVRAGPSLADELAEQGRLRGRLDTGAPLLAEPVLHCDGDESGHKHHAEDDIGLGSGSWRVLRDDGRKSDSGVRLAHQQVVAYQLGNRAPIKQGTDRRLAALAERVDPARWQVDNAHLASHDRLSAAGFGAAADWLTAQFSALGLQTSTHNFDYPAHLAPVGTGGRNRNILGLQRGSGDELVIVGAHLDSRNENYDASRPSPGAEDNASGCAGVLETARVLAGQNFEASILYVCYGMEEVGLVGSRAHAATVSPERTRAMVNLDMISFDNDGRRKLGITGTWASRQLIDSMAAHAAGYTSLESTVSHTTCCSDHMPYLERGIPAVLLISGDFSAYGAYYHTTIDLPHRLSPVLASEAVKLAVVTVAGLAGFDSRSNIDGYWYDPAQSGHGLHVEKQQDDSVIAAWYTFDGQGRRFWLIALGALDGNLVELQAYATEGGAFPPAFDPAAIETTPWGTLTFTFGDCSSAELQWQAIDSDAFADGSMSLTRLSHPAAGGCH
jgi:hypothetical protein